VQDRPDITDPAGFPRQVPESLLRLQSRALLVGAAALAACALGALFFPEQFFRAYLQGYVLWLGIALGSLALLMIQHLTGGAWGLVIRRILEASTRTLPLLAVLFVPLLLGLSWIYPWARPDQVATDYVLQHREPYLNLWFFLVRVVVYFGTWIAFAYVLNRWSHEQDRVFPPPPERKFRLLSAPGLLAYGLTVTFMSFDWIMAVDAHWYSTIFGVLTMGGQAVSAMSFTVILLFMLSSTPPLSDVLSRAHFHDLGKLLFAFVMLWAYFSFSQLLIIWSGNLPDEIPWYLYRTGGGWQYVGALLAAGHFAVPFLLLLSRETKRNPQLLARIAAWLLVMRAVDIFWTIAPEFHQAGFRVQLMDVLAPIGLGGLWLYWFLRELQTRPLLPINDPYLKEAFVHGGR
jgi:hypothetical protein